MWFRFVIILVSAFFVFLFCRLKICSLNSIIETDIKNKRQYFADQLAKIRTETEKCRDKVQDINRNIDDNYKPKLENIKRNISNIESIPLRRLNVSLIQVNFILFVLISLCFFFIF